MFGNTIDYTRGVINNSSESYTNYAEYISRRHCFKDMLYHDAEVAAVRLAEMGVFEKTENFEPEKTVTVLWFIKSVLLLAGKLTPHADEDEVCRLAKENGIYVDTACTETLTRGLMIGLLSNVCDGVADSAQYELMLRGDQESKEKAAKCIALGLIPVKGADCFEVEINRAEAAEVLYRLATPSMRLVLPYNIGNAYKKGKTEYLVKNSYTLNERGIQLGAWTNYNRQAFAFEKFGKRPIDRVDFHKWVYNEQVKGEYKFGKFGNEQSAHRLGSTVITSVEIAANLKWNPRFHTDMIPSFYEPDITNPETRQAAKNYMYAFVQAMLAEIKGDVMISVDYEVDWEMDLDREVTEDSKWRASEWSKWYVEACAVARQAAKDMGEEDRLKMIVIYNNVNAMTKLGPAENQWMLDCAEASDVIGIDIYYYNLVEDRTDPSKFMQDIRYLINNYSLGKPVMVVENGMPVTDIVTNEIQAGYFRNLFREFRFELAEGGFLNKKLNAYLFWDLIRMEKGRTGAFQPDGTPYPSAPVLQKEFARVESIRGYNPSVLDAVEDVSAKAEILLNIKSGTEFDMLTLLTETDADEKSLEVELGTEGTVFITVNGKYHYSSVVMSCEHNVNIPQGLVNGINQIDIYFGNTKKPFNQTVKAIKLS
ncbi:MAG: hypothetical protein IKD04_06535 [Clostridia bacterium]|nr:hypothetical protein [Clostridia bacterium]